MGAESRGAARVSRAEVADAELLGRLQHRFQAEFEEPGPDAALFAERITVLLEEGLTAALLVHAPEPAGFALLRHRTGYCSRA